jgi:hypothetical protein
MRRSGSWVRPRWLRGDLLYAAADPVDEAREPGVVEQAVRVLLWSHGLRRREHDEVADVSTVASCTGHSTAGLNVNPLESWPLRPRRPWLAGVRVAEFERWKKTR